MAGPAIAHSSEFLSDVLSGLTKSPQKELPSKYLYDQLGSALFEAITVLPEYGLTRADERILRRCSPLIANRIAGTPVIAELGSGTGRKTRAILEAFANRGSQLRYHPIDVSPAALAICRDQLEAFARITAHHSHYLDGLRQVVRSRKSERLLVLFLGSTIGNFERRCASEFLRSLRFHLAPGDLLLIGTDLVKDRQTMIEAYDDPTGVTASFNLNLLGRVNRELGADFDQRAFCHQARYDTEHQRIEMHLESTKEQTVLVANIEIRFRAGETIWTESSHKFRVEECEQMATSAGFRQVDQYVDGEWPFAENLWEAI